jgi:predicted dienelactone hydrolase
MRLFRYLLVLAFCPLATLGQAAGLRLITAPAEASSPALRAAVWSPCAEPVGEVKLRSMTLAATENCAIAGEKLPLIVISHGYGGSFTGHHDLGETLADGGFVVVALSHPADSGADMSRADTLAALAERPADITRLIDYMLSAWPDRGKLDPQRIGFFGFSRGGFTGLVVAGGNPDFRKAGALCPETSPWPICAVLQTNETPAFAHDPRVKALVIADPAFGPLFGQSGLKEVKTPIQLWQSERSGEDITGGEVTPEFVLAIDRDLPLKPDLHLVSGAGHFAFLPPCTAELAKRIPRICTDRGGFDRAAFHAQFNAAVSEFFRKHLGASGQP